MSATAPTDPATRQQPAPQYRDRAVWPILILVLVLVGFGISAGLVYLAVQHPALAVPLQVATGVIVLLATVVTSWSISPAGKADGHRPQHSAGPETVERQVFGQAEAAFVDVRLGGPHPAGAAGAALEGTGVSGPWPSERRVVLMAGDPTDVVSPLSVCRPVNVSLVAGLLLCSARPTPKAICQPRHDDWCHRSTQSAEPAGQVRLVVFRLRLSELHRDVHRGATRHRDRHTRGRLRAGTGRRGGFGRGEEVGVGLAVAAGGRSLSRSDVPWVRASTNIEKRAPSAAIAAKAAQSACVGRPDHQPPERRKSASSRSVITMLTCVGVLLGWPEDLWRRGDLGA